MVRFCIILKPNGFYDFSDPGKCRNFPGKGGSQSQRPRNRHSAAASVRWNRRLVLNCLTAGNAAATLRTKENLPFADPPSVATVREQSGRAAWRQRLRATKIKIAAAHSLSLGLLPSIYQPDAAALYRQLKAIDVDEAVDKLREGQSDCIFPFTTKICWKRRLTTFAYLNLNCSLSAPVTNTEKRFFNLAQPRIFRY